MNLRSLFLLFLFLTTLSYSYVDIPAWQNKTENGKTGSTQDLVALNQIYPTYTDHYIFMHYDKALNPKQVVMRTTDFKFKKNTEVLDVGAIPITSMISYQKEFIREVENITYYDEIRKEERCNESICVEETTCIEEECWEDWTCEAPVCWNETITEQRENRTYYNESTYRPYVNLTTIAEEDIDNTKYEDYLIRYRTYNFINDYFNWTDFDPASVPCGTYSTPNTVLTMNESISVNGSTCITIGAQNVTLDCNGFSITGNNSTTTYGVYSNQFNTTVKNCEIEDFSIGIYTPAGATDAIIINNTIDGGLLSSSPANALGMYILGEDSLIANNSITMPAGTGLGNGGSSHNSIYINNSIDMSNNETASDMRRAILVEAGSNVSIDCMGASLIGMNGSSNHQGVYSTQYNTTVKNCDISNFSTGIYIDGDTADYANITNNTINLTYATSCSVSNGACNGIFLRYADNSKITNNLINTYRYAINLYSNANNNSIENNNAYTSSVYTVFLTSLSNTTIRNNNFNASGNAAMYLNTVTNSLVEYNNVSNIDAGTDSAIVLYDGSSNNTIRYNYFSSPDIMALRISTNSHNNSIKYNNITAGGQALRFTGNSDDNNVSFNNITASSTFVVGTASGNNNNNRIFNNSIVSTGSGEAIGISDVTDTGNYIYNNNITASTWVNDASGGNYYNTTSTGNIYYFANGTASWDVYDIVCLGTYPCWADAGTNRPFNSSLTEWSGSGEDWYPYTSIPNSISINTSIIYPVGYSQTSIPYLMSGIGGNCSMAITIQTNETGTTPASVRSLTCNRYYLNSTLIDSNTTSNLNTTFYFLANTTNTYAFNCTVSISGIYAYTQTEMVNFIGAEFCIEGEVEGLDDKISWGFAGLIVLGGGLTVLGIKTMKGRKEHG